MADILIRGMEMPKENDILVFDTWHGKMYARSTANTGTRRYEVVSIPEGHGRLIDADVMVEGLMKCAKNPPDDDQNSRWFYLFAAEIAKSCETIVPAEGGGEDG